MGFDQGVWLGIVDHDRSQRILAQDTLTLEPTALSEGLGVAGWLLVERQVTPDRDADIRRLIRVCRPRCQQD